MGCCEDSFLAWSHATQRLFVVHVGRACAAATSKWVRPPTCAPLCHRAQPPAHSRTPPHTLLLHPCNSPCLTPHPPLCIIYGVGGAARVGLHLPAWPTHPPHPVPPRACCQLRQSWSCVVLVWSWCAPMCSSSADHLIQHGCWVCLISL